LLSDVGSLLGTEEKSPSNGGISKVGTKSALDSQKEPKGGKLFANRDIGGGGRRGNAQQIKSKMEHAYIPTSLSGGKNGEREKIRPGNKKGTEQFM